MAHAAVWMRANDEDFAERYRLHRSSVISLCRRLLGSAEQAEDAAHEVFARAHSQRQQFDVTRSFSNWVLGIATHYCVDLLRRRSIEARIFGSEDAERAAATADALSPLGLLLAQERQQELREAIRTLPTKYRVPLVLFVYHEQTYDEIGEAIGVPRSHVAILIFRAKQQLRKALSRTIEDHGGRR